MIEACTAVLRQGQCELAPPTPGSTPHTVAVVSWRDTQHAAVLIEVGVTTADGTHWHTQSVEFQPIDPLPERWRVVGITIATLVGDLDAAETEREAGPVSSAPVTQTDKPPGTSQREPVLGTGVGAPRSPEASAGPTRQSWVASGGLVAPGGKTVRAGLWLRGAWVPQAPLFLTVASRFLAAPRSQGVAPRWLGLSVGVGAQQSVGGGSLHGWVELLVDRVWVAADQATGAKALPGARLGVGGAWPVSGPVALVLGGDVTRYSRGVRVRRDGDEVVAFPASTYTLALGGRYAF